MEVEYGLPGEWLSKRPDRDRTGRHRRASRAGRVGELAALAYLTELPVGRRRRHAGGERRPLVDVAIDTVPWHRIVAPGPGAHARGFDE